MRIGSMRFGKMNTGTFLSILLVVLVGCAPSPTPTAVPTATIAPTLTLTPAWTATIAPSPTVLFQGSVDHSIGTESAYLTLTMVSDFTCTVCVDVALSMILLRQKYPDDVRVIYRPFPNPADEKSMLAAQAVEAAYDQGQFWALHDLLYARQSEWLPLDVTTFRERVRQYARDAGVADLVAFDTAIDSSQFRELLLIAREESLIRGVGSAPALLFNEIQYNGRIDLFALDNQTRLTLLEKRYFKSAPGYTLDTSKKYTATLTTEFGDVQIELLTDQAPVTVNNFLFLVENGWYKDITFHLANGSVVETGDPSGTGLGTAGYYIYNEATPDMTFDQPGWVAMASDIRRDDEHTGSSRFFISLKPLEPRPLYDGQYAVFGRVISGLDLLQKVTLRNPFGDLVNLNPAPGSKLIRITVTTS